MGLLFIRNETNCRILPTIIAWNSGRFSILSAQTIRYFGLKAGDYISFTQDTENPKRFYFVPGKIEGAYMYKILAFKNKNNYFDHRIGSVSFNKSICDIYNTHGLNFRLYIKEIPEMIKGVKHYPITLL
jgi:hypothetical protein